MVPREIRSQVETFVDATLLFWHYYAKGIGFLLFPFYVAGRVVQLWARPPIDTAEAERLTVIRMMFTRASIPAPFNVDAIGPAPEVWICEGPTDTMTAATHSVTAVGLPGTTFKREWVELFKDKRVFLATDADDAGDKAAAAIARAFYNAGAPNPLRIRLPAGQDLNEYLARFKDGRAEGRTS
jgi:hypothetical protein